MASYRELPSVVECVPLLLRSLKSWLTWKLEKNPQGKPTKVPDQSTLNLGACRTWEQVKGVQRWTEGGIGFVTASRVLQVNDPRGGQTLCPLVFGDLDGCRDPVSGDVVAEARRYLEMLGVVYVEVSPSGTGLRFAGAMRPLPAGKTLRAKVKLPFAAPAGVKKTPELQLFGLGPTGYVTITGRRVDGSAEDITAFSIEALATEIGLFRDDEIEAGELPAGFGEEPSIEDLDEDMIARYGLNDPLRDGKWRTVCKEKSASEAYHVLVQRVLTEARGHVGPAVNYLLTSTAWGRGEIEDSADPDKYTRPKWVKNEVMRAARKMPPSRPDQVFEDLGPEVPDGPGTVGAADAKGEEGRRPSLPDGDPLDVAEQWEDHGPLVHLPTGIATIDEMTGGGLVLGSRVYGIGAPDAGKTALVVQILDHYLAMGIPAAFLGVDEEPADILMRLMQRRGLTRKECEERSPATMQKVREALTGLPLKLFGGDVSIEEAAAALHRFACERSPGVDRPACVLVIDSVQAAHVIGEQDEDSLYRSVTKRVRQIRVAATRYRMLVISTSEMNRAAYKHKRAEDQVQDMASAKESGAIEFSARVMFVLRSVPGTSDVIELRVAKNKHGPSHRNDQQGVFLRLDRSTQMLVEDRDFEPLDDVEEQKATKEDEKRSRDAGRLVALLAAKGPQGRNAACAALSLSRDRVDVARDWLKELGAVVLVPGDRGALVMQVGDLSKLPPIATEIFLKESGL